MMLEAYHNTVGGIFDAIRDERLIPVALEKLAKYVGSAGAAYMLINKHTARVVSADWWGAFSGSRAEYLAHYGKIDPFRAFLEKTADGSVYRLTESLPQRALRHDEWYNDFLLKGGVRDILGAKLHESPSRMIILGLHCAAGDFDPFLPDMEALQQLMPVLGKAARLHVQLIDSGLRSAITHGDLKYPSDGVFFTDANGQVVEMNPAAERVLCLGDGLTIHNGQFCARRNFETAKLGDLIAKATAEGGSHPSGTMLVARDCGRPSYIVRVTSVTAGDLPMAMIVVSGPDEERVSERELSDLYGLSPAESRIALALARGKRLTELAAEFGVQITTLRTQLSSILKKCEVKRQSDLVRLMGSIPLVQSSHRETDPL
jgi:DNA-binding CsgD family transcriptional regulator